MASRFSASKVFRIPLASDGNDQKAVTQSAGNLAKHFRRVNKKHELAGRTYFPEPSILVKKTCGNSLEAAKTFSESPQKRHSIVAEFTKNMKLRAGRTFQSALFS